MKEIKRKKIVSNGYCAEILIEINNNDFENMSVFLEATEGYYYVDYERVNRVSYKNIGIEQLNSCEEEILAIWQDIALSAEDLCRKKETLKKLGYV